VAGVFVVSRRDWVQGEVTCPKCGLPLDAERDDVSYFQAAGDPRWAGARVLHRRCGHTFRMTFVEVKAAG
jgi:hypothetical protein